MRLLKQPSIITMVGFITRRGEIQSELSSDRIRLDPLELPLMHSDISGSSRMSVEASSFRDEFVAVCDEVANNLHRRVGLVPNYFMTRGEDTPRMMESRKSFLHKTSEKIFKLCHPKDFREIAKLPSMERLVDKIDGARTSYSDNAVLESIVREELNKPKFKYGDTLLSLLVRKRHLRLLRLL